MTKNELINNLGTWDIVKELKRSYYCMEALSFAILMTYFKSLNSNPGTIAKSGTKAFMEAMAAGGDISMLSGYS